MNLIYQYWDGPVRESCLAGVKTMREYAKRIGAEYVFDNNPNFVRKHFGFELGQYTPHYGAFKPIFDTSFDKYDKILFADTDVFPIDGLTTNIFDEFTDEIGICNEPFQPKQRTVTKGRITSEQDEKWAKIVKRVWGCDVPRTEEGLVEVFNTGMVLYSKQARLKARETWTGFRNYVNTVRAEGLDSFYTCDQPYLHAMMFAKNFNVQRMNNGWNSYIHYTRDNTRPDRYLCDWRNEETKFVHVQFAGADNLDEETHWKIVNLPREKWGIAV
jgi:hypothetical protein